MITDAQKLLKLAELIKNFKEPPVEPPDNIYDRCGGNADDCYEMGYRHGEQTLAVYIRQILEGN